MNQKSLKEKRDLSKIIQGNSFPKGTFFQFHSLPVQGQGSSWNQDTSFVI